MKREKAGFTLAELLVVVAIIGVLVAVAIPVFGGALDKAREAACAANCRSLKGELTTLWLTTDGSEEEKKAAVKTAFAAAENAGGICPSGGTISYELDIKDGTVCGVTVTCNVHGGTVEQTMLDKMKNLVSGKGGLTGWMATNNTKLREYYFNNIIEAENETKTWPAKDFNGKTYYVQPCYNQSDGETVIYANESHELKDNWNANAIYFPEGTTVGGVSYSGWYYGEKSVGIVGGNVFIGYDAVVEKMTKNKWTKLN